MSESIKIKHAAIIKESSGKSVEIAEAAGLFQCLLEHKVAETKGTFIWQGPRISRLCWLEIMSFFEWTQQRCRSEAQVRLFIHPEHGWKAWAFPQVGDTGMTTKEIDSDPVTTEQRRQFAGWRYWGTVHHHCAMSAFASGTDTENERNQEGLHFTVGHMDKPQRDLHFRIYVKGCKFEPHLDSFWDIGDDVRLRMKNFALEFNLMPDADKVAQRQMSQSAESYRNELQIGAESRLFPVEWEANYRLKPIEITPVSVAGEYYGHRGQGGHHTNWSKTFCTNCQEWVYHETQDCWRLPINSNTVPRKLTKDEKKEIKLMERCKELLADMENIAVQENLEVGTFDKLVQMLHEPEGELKVVREIIENCMMKKISVEDFAEIHLQQVLSAQQPSLPPVLKQAALEEQRAAQQAANKDSEALPLHTNGSEWEGYGG